MFRDIWSGRGSLLEVGDPLPGQNCLQLVEVHVKRSLIALSAILMAFLALSPNQALAQDEARTVVAHDNLISGSPFALVAGAFNAEYEKALNGNLSAGIAAGWVEFDHSDYTGVAGLLRYYPKQGVFRGFFLGGRAGLYKKEYEKAEEDFSSNGLGIGVDLGYGWLLGPSDAFFVGLAVGGTHMLSGDGGTFPAASILNVGVAF